MSFTTSALIVTWVALLLMGLVVSGLVRQVHALSAGMVRRPESVGPRPGAPAPELDRLAPRLPAVLLFLDPTCRTCTDVLDEAAAMASTGQHEMGGALSVHALYPGTVPDGAVRPLISVHGDQQRLFAAYDAIVTPFAVVVDGAGRVASAGPLGSRSALGEVLDRADLAQLGGNS